MALSQVWRATISKTAKSWCLPKNMYNHKTVQTVHRKHIQSQCCSFGVTSVKLTAYAVVVEVGVVTAARTCPA